MNASSKKLKCVLCNSIKLEKVTNFPPTPIANQLFDPESLPLEGQEFLPLNLCLCLDCKHLQIDTLVDPTILFADYPYVSNSSMAMAKRLDTLAEKYISQFNLSNSDLVVEIGSNDGYLLSQIKSSGCKVLGIDPAIIATDIAIRSEIPTIVDFFSSRVARTILDDYSTPKLIIANNVLAHSDSLQDIFSGISILMGPDSTAVIEFSYVVDVFEKLLFDTIYHEHTSYHSIAPLKLFLIQFNLEIFDVERFDAHGGSARVFIKKIGARQPISPSVELAIHYEAVLGIHKAKTWDGFNQRVSELAEKLNKEISEIKARGETLLGYGIPAKFTSLFHILGLREIDFDFIVDDNPLKIGKLAPGTRIQISSPADTPVLDNAVIFSWNYSTSIVENIVKAERVRNTILLPLPEFRVIKLSEDRHSL
jgi:hypothetical protein